VNTSAPLDVASATERVLGWQTKLHRWAGQDEQKPFGDLFNLVCDPVTLLVAWERVKRNRGSRTAGVDGQTRWHVEQRGVENVLGELRQALKDGSYAPLPVREHEIPKRRDERAADGRLSCPSVIGRAVPRRARRGHRRYASRLAARRRNDGRAPQTASRLQRLASLSTRPTAQVATFLRKPYPPPTLTRGGPRNGVRS
jgi:hypothetical protein